MNQRDKLSAFWKGTDIAPGSAVDLIIDSVKEEELGQKKEIKDVVVFRNHSKKLVLNTTNRRTLVTLFGDFDEDWVGKKITLYSCETRSPNGVSRGLRILLKGESKLVGLPPEAEAFMYGA